MISTRLHGLIDYGVAAFLGKLAASPALPPPVRSVLGGTAAYHASYALVTDYELGVQKRVGMRQHLMLDLLGAAGLCGAGLLMRRQPAGARALLLAAGCAELAVIAFSETKPRPVETVGYLPLDVPKPVAPGVWVVDSAMDGLLGKVLSVRMTVLRLPDGGLLLHSPTRFSPGLRQALAALGPVRHLVAPNLVHWMFLRDWQRACPDAVTSVAPGVKQRGAVQRAGVVIDHELTESPPRAWGGAIETVMIPGGLGFREATLFHKPSSTLVLTDTVLNLEPKKVPWPVRPIAWLFGSTAPDGMPPPYVRATIRSAGPAAQRAAARLVALRPARVIFAHGRPFLDDATPALRRSFRWLLG